MLFLVLNYFLSNQFYPISFNEFYKSIKTFSVSFDLNQINRYLTNNVDQSGPLARKPARFRGVVEKGRRRQFSRRSTRTVSYLSTVGQQRSGGPQSRLPWRKGLQGCISLPYRRLRQHFGLLQRYASSFPLVASWARDAGGDEKLSKVNFTGND